MSKNKYLILDVYPNDNWRICKDTAGGYGTGNDFGNSFFAKILNVFTNSQIHQPAMYIGYLLSIIKNNGSEIEYINKIDKKKISEADFVILPSSIVAHETEIQTLKYLNEIKKKTFVTGIFANVKKEKYLTDQSIVINGEPEKFFIDFGKLENTDEYFLNNSGKEISVGFVDDLDTLPFPDWEMYNKIKTLKNNFLDFDFKVAIPLLATRGCPYSCFNYCTYPLQQGRKVRARSPKNIVEEIEHWSKIFKKPKFVFRDPVFSINRKHTKELCELIISKNLKISFLIETHLKNCDDELISLLKNAGLKLIYVGVESKHADVLKDIKRQTISEDDQYKIIEKLEKNNITVKSMFMIGNPEDTDEKVYESISYSKFLKNKLVQFSVFTPYPGTPIFDTYENIIIENKLEKYNQYNLVFKHKYFDNSHVIKLKNQAYRSFYLSFKSINILFLFFKNIIR
tara:strand:- start:872 stop:2236 length:1365 start_codon:yes stop_codon:yes gene_type:complete